jgi:hypothetical protein
MQKIEAKEPKYEAEAEGPAGVWALAIVVNYAASTRKGRGRLRQ